MWRRAAAVGLLVLLWLAAAAWPRGGGGTQHQTDEEARQWVESQSPAGRSAGVILRIGSDSLLLEQKDDGYPLEFWRNSLDLMGGNGLVHEGFLEILLRELSEEFSPEFASRLHPQLERCEQLGTYSDYVFAMTDDHLITTRIFTAEIAHEEALAALRAKVETGEEGRGVVVPFSELAPPTRFAWAVDLVLDRYFRQLRDSGGVAEVDPADTAAVRVCSKSVSAAQRHCRVYHMVETSSGSMGRDGGPFSPQKGTELTCP